MSLSSEARLLPIGLSPTCLMTSRLATVHVRVTHMVIPRRSWLFWEGKIDNTTPIRWHNSVGGRDKWPSLA